MTWKLSGLVMVGMLLGGCPEPGKAPAPGVSQQGLEGSGQQGAGGNQPLGAPPPGQGQPTVLQPAVLPDSGPMQPGMMPPPPGQGQGLMPPPGGSGLTLGVPPGGEGAPPTADLPPGMADADPSRPSAVGPDAKISSPYSPYPMSFPKMLAGILYWEYEKPSMQVSNEQAQQLIEPVAILSKSWQGVLYAEDAVKYALSCAQLKFTGSNKQRFERGDSPTRRSYRPLADRYLIYEVGAALALLRERVKESDSVRFEPCPKEKLVEKGASIDLGGSFTDVASAILAMETEPELRIGSRQAVPLLKIFEDAATAERTTVIHEERIRNILTKKQILAIGEDIIAVTQMKQRWAGGMSGTQSDPLTTRVLEILRARAEGRPVPEKPLPAIHGDPSGSHILSDPPVPGPAPKSVR